MILNNQYYNQINSVSKSINLNESHLATRAVGGTNPWAGDVQGYDSKSYENSRYTSILKNNQSILANNNQFQNNVKFETSINNDEDDDQYDDDSQENKNKLYSSNDSLTMSPNAQLYQKLQSLVSNSSFDQPNDQISLQVNKLLSNPNIKQQLKQLHTQLLENPNQYLPQLETILLSNPISLENNVTQQNNTNVQTNEPNDLKKYYLNKTNSNETKSFVKDESIDTKTNNIDIDIKNLNYDYAVPPTARIIAREYKL